jgi:ketosteroid isomerase-like protein
MNLRLVMILAMLFCRWFTEPSFSQTENAQHDDVKSVLDAQALAWNTGDIEGYMEGYWKSDSLLFTSGGNIQRGWNATFVKYKTSYDTKEKMGTLRFSDLELYLPSPDVAWVFGRWALERTSDRPSGVFTLVMKKFSDGWKIVHDHTSSYDE